MMLKIVKGTFNFECVADEFENDNGAFKEKLCALGTLVVKKRIRSADGMIPLIANFPFCWLLPMDSDCIQFVEFLDYLTTSKRICVVELDIVGQFIGFTAHDGRQNAICCFYLSSSVVVPDEFKELHHVYRLFQDKMKSAWE